MSRTAEFFLAVDEEGNYEVDSDLDCLRDNFSDPVHIVKFEVEIPSSPLPVVRVKLVGSLSPPPVQVDLPSVKISTNIAPTGGESP